ncbi:MAG TPA: aminopeptidase [Candidatus Acidoferrum sp.]|nr:aminopeptidase [Candidatus Acidoferrum sp.]
MTVMEAVEAAMNALECVLEAKKGENIAIFCDAEKSDVCEPFSVGALKLGLKERLVKLKTERTFRKEIPPEIKEIFRRQRTDIFVNLLRGTREETTFRIKLTEMETQTCKARLAHCPGITLDMLTNGALALTIRDYRKMQDFANSLIRRLRQASHVEITNPAGTSISMSVERRPFFTDTMIDWNRLNWMNMPTGEVMVAPVENSLEGKLICDMAIGGIGPIRAAVGITAKNGKVQKTESQDDQVLRSVEDSLKTDNRASIVGEFAFGINPKARFVEEFLEAEKILGTVHIAFGNNLDMPGGRNPSINHMDFLISKPTVKIINEDNSTFDVLVDGTFKQL